MEGFSNLFILLFIRERACNIKVIEDAIEEIIESVTKAWSLQGQPQPFTNIILEEYSRVKQSYQIGLA